MTMTYLGFFMNRTSREEFVAPVVASDATTAKTELEKAYPDSRYQLQTIYSRQELEHVLAGIDRWPGVPSKVQPPLKADLTKVTARTGGLPPLPGQVTSATVEKVEQNTQAMPTWMQSFVQQQNSRAAAKAAPKAETVAAQPAARPTMQAMLQQMNQTKAVTPQPIAQQPQSLIERLKAAKGETVIKAPAMPMVQAPAKAGSVIDILKGMRK